MPYIGRNTDKLSNVEVLDNITFDGSQSYTLQKNSVNFTPSSANTILISIDGVVQAGNFTVSGSTIDFGVAVASSSTCDFILHYGVGLITTPADGTITNAKLAASAINSQTAETSIAGGDEVLIYDTSASALRKMTRTNFVSGVGGDLTPAFSAYQGTATVLSDASLTTIKFDTENFDTDSAFNTSNYTFTVPSGEGGKYFFSVRMEVEAGGLNRYDNFYIRLRKNGSSTLKEIHYYPGGADSPRTNTWELNCTATLAAADAITVAVYMDFNAGAPQIQPYSSSSEFAGFKILGA